MHSLFELRSKNASIILIRKKSILDVSFSEVQDPRVSTVAREAWSST
jgi:hypothetical protein